MKKQNRRFTVVISLMVIALGIALCAPVYADNTTAGNTKTWSWIEKLLERAPERGLEQVPERALERVPERGLEKLPVETARENLPSPGAEAIIDVSPTAPAEPEVPGADVPGADVPNEVVPNEPPPPPPPPHIDGPSVNTTGDAAGGNPSKNPEDNPPNPREVIEDQ